MKAAIAVWDNRVAPVFDVAGQVHLVVTDAEGRIIEESDAPLAGAEPLLRARALAGLGVGVLVCGAISRGLQTLVEAQGIRVAPFVAGDLREVIRAWQLDRLTETRFAMPGCCGRRRGRRGAGRRREGRGCGAAMTRKDPTKQEEESCQVETRRGRWVKDR